MVQQRNIEFDIVKGFGIILMVIGHMNLNDMLNHYIYAFHMPLFFIISGMFYKQKDLKLLFVSRFKRLLVPYFVFGGLYWAVYNSIRFFRFHQTDELLFTLKTLILFPTRGLVIESALWFLPVLFIVEFIYTFIDKKIPGRKAMTIVILLLGIIGFLLPYITNYRFPWGIDSALVAILFYHSGRIIKEVDLVQKIDSFLDKKPVLFWAGIVITFGVNALLIFCNGKINMRLIHWGMPPLTYLNAIVAVIVYIVIAKVMVRNRIIQRSLVIRWLQNVSITSIVYLCVNHPAILISRFAVTRIIDNVPIQVVLTFAVSMFIMYLLSMLFCKTKLKVLIGQR